MTEEDKFRKIFNHPDKEEIISRLVGGESLRKVEAWLKKKHPTSRKLQVSYITLQKFRKEYLNLEADVLKDLQKERASMRLQKLDEQKTESVKDTDAYKEGLANYVQQSLIDYNDTLVMLRDKCLAGLEKLESLDDYKGSHLNHAAMQGYLNKLQDLMELHHKMIQEQEKNAKDQVEEDYETLRQQVSILKEVIKEIFQETAPELQPIFVSRVKQRMEEAGLDSE